MKKKKIIFSTCLFFLFNAIACFGYEVADTFKPPPAAEANTSIGFLQGERAGYAVKLADVKDEIKTFTTTVLEPHNKDAAEQKRQMAAHIQAGYDATSQASVDAYNRRMGELNTWGATIDARKERETPKYIDMKTREADYTGKIDELENKIKDLIRRYRPDCLDMGGTIEAIVNCWGIYWDGEGKRGPLPVVVPGTNYFQTGVPNPDAFKTYRNEQADKIYKGIDKMTVPAPTPPQKGIIEKTTDDVIDYFRNYMNNLNRYKARRTTPTAVLAVRG